MKQKTQKMYGSCRGAALGNEGEEYYQAAYTVNDADGKTLARELAPLESIKDNNPKYLITMDFVPLTLHNGSSDSS